MKISDIVKVSPAERAVLSELSSHDTAQQIADALFVSIYTVKSHLYPRYAKFNVGSKHRLIARAYEWGFLCLDGSDNERK